MWNLCHKDKRQKARNTPEESWRQNSELECSTLLLSYLVVLPVNVRLVGEGDGQGEAGEEHQQPQQTVA